MPPRRAVQRGTGSETATWLLFVFIVCIIVGVVAVVLWLRMTADRPVLDKHTLCPVNGGPRSITVVLLDTSDQWPEVTRAEVRKRLETAARQVPHYGLLELRLLDPDVAGGR